MIDWEKVEVSPLHRVGTKLRVAAVCLALLGSGSAVWLALEGQKVRLQQSILAERQARFDALGTELALLEERLKSRTGELASLQASLAHIGRQRDEASAALARAHIERDRAAAERAAAVSQRSEILSAAER